jgi:hypothetical protein
MTSGHIRATLAIGLVAIGALGWNVACSSRSVPQQPAAAMEADHGVTDIAIESQVLRTGVKRFGINLSGQTFYDSGQMLKNLVFRNPGFEGETWQSFLLCDSVAALTCTDDNSSIAWPAGFLAGAQAEIVSGPNANQQGSIRDSQPLRSGHGVQLTFATAPRGLARGDTLLIRIDKPGAPETGWWHSDTPGVHYSPEFRDLSPNTPGKQALRVESGPGQTATLSSYFDSTATRSFLQLRGRFVLRFRAKGLGTGPRLTVKLSRLDQRRGERVFLERRIDLAAAWHDYSFPFTANEEGTALGTVGLNFTVAETTLLLDDVELIEQGSPGNPTAFRDEVVEALRALHPGILRFMDNGTSFGSTLEDLLAPPFARRRGGWRLNADTQEDIPIGLHEALALAQTIHAEPWYTLPATFSPAEAERLIEYLAGPATTPYGARRAALGQSAPWTSVFPVIHLELGNEVWNEGDFGGSSLPEPGVQAQRDDAVFSAVRRSPWFRGEQFDLIAGAQAGNSWRTREFLKTASQQNSIAFAPYLFGLLDDVSSIEAVFGTMFAEPERLDLAANQVPGSMAESVALARSAPHPASAAVYEVNLGTIASHRNDIAQWQIDATAASIGSAVAVADHMLLMLRELGIVNQCLFALPEYANRFNQPDGAPKTIPLWGSVIDMGGPTNLRRPSYLALQLLNQAMLPNELAINLTGANPTWNQPASRNDNLPASQSHLLQAFAFADGPRRSLILINLSRTAALPVAFTGTNRPVGPVAESRLTSGSILDTNEEVAKVAIVRRQLTSLGSSNYSLPPFSITTLQWESPR